MNIISLVGASLVSSKEGQLYCSYVLIEHWMDSLDRGKCLDIIKEVIYSDFQKAFDKVSHHHLLTDLQSFGL